MTVREALHAGTGILFLAELDTPLLDASLLLGHVLELSKEALFAAFPDEIAERDYRLFEELIDRRAQGIPVSYIRGKKEFYGLEFIVDERVLVPRPDTETLIEEAQSLLAGEAGILAALDLGTGSGCIAVTLKHLFPDLSIVGADISSEAGAVFAQNAKRILGSPLPFVLSDLFKNIDGTFDLIVSNPPYVDDETARRLKDTGWPEPLIALSGGLDGTDLLVAIIGGAALKLNPGGFLLLEADPRQMKKLYTEMERRGYGDIGIRNDLSGKERVIWGRKKIA